MRHGPPIFIRVIVALVVVGAAGYWLIQRERAEANGSLAASGTIEAPEVAISAEMAGRVVEVAVQPGERVAAGALLAQLDTTLLEAQLEQAEAGLAAAQAGYDLLAAGPSAAQLAAAEAVVNRAQVSLDSLNDQLADAQAEEDETVEAVADLTAEIASVQATATGPEQQGLLAGLQAQLTLAQQALAAKMTQVRLLESQRAVAEATLDSAQAQLVMAGEGARPEQLAAAQAQVDAAQATIRLLATQIGRQSLTAPVDGVVLARAVEPGEMAAPGATLLVLGRLDELTITVYVPEDRYGAITLGQAATVQVDSFPGEAFSATVRRIADEAEFTPRNVQTAEGRASTVFAIELALADGQGKLKPGMPADVNFEGD